MAITERLALIADFDTRGAVRGMQDLESSAQRNLERGVEGRLDRVGQTMTKVGAGMIGVGTAAAVGLVKAADKTRLLEDQTTRAEAIFGDAFDTLQTEAEGAADSLGISQRAFLEANNDVATFGRGAGLAGEELAGFSTSVVDVTRDLASFTGRGFEESIDAVSAAFRGEFDSLESLGVQLNATKIKQEGVERGLGEVEAGTAAYVELVRDLITEQAEMTGALGDYERTADSATNQQERMNAQWEDLQAELGEGVLPIMSSVMDLVSDGVGHFKNLNDATGGLAGTVAAWGTGLTIAGGALSTVVGKVIEHRRRLAPLTSALGRHKTAITGVTAAVGLATVAYNLWRKSQERVKNIGEEFLADLRETGNVAESLGNTFGDLLFESRDLADAMNVADQSVGDMVAAFREGPEAFDAWVTKVLEANAAHGMGYDTLKVLEDQLRGTGNEIRGRIEDWEAAKEATSGATEGINDLRIAAREANEPVRDFGKEGREAASAFERVAEMADEARQKTADYIDEITEGLSSEIDYRNAVRDTFEALKDVNEAQGDVNDVTSEAAEKHDEALGKILDQAEAYVEMKRKSGDTRSEQDLMVEALEGVRLFLDGPLAEAVDGHIARLNNIPRNITTTVTLRGREVEVHAGPGHLTGEGPGDSHSGRVIAGPSSRQVTTRVRGNEAIIPLDNPAAASRVLGQASVGGPVINIYGRPSSEQFEDGLRELERNGVLAVKVLR